ncbi:hypothetical protein [Caldimonas brevitalea]|uniref:hypothetical protein n=1 Tax=Caldimonas brevitalea TaxID=413882 RepID=UPI0012F75C7F|nr:hypothetical protein [Caldimonas brevitalea]
MQLTTGRISVAATKQRIQAFSRAQGLNTELSGLLVSWLQRAEAAGLAGEEPAAVVKVLRRPSGPQ